MTKKQREEESEVWKRMEERNSQLTAEQRVKKLEMESGGAEGREVSPRARESRSSERSSPQGERRSEQSSTRRPDNSQRDREMVGNIQDQAENRGVWEARRPQQGPG
jgi:hypothetical protein